MMDRRSDLLEKPIVMNSRATLLKFFDTTGLVYVFVAERVAPCFITQKIRDPVWRVAALQKYLKRHNRHASESLQELRNLRNMLVHNNAYTIGWLKHALERTGHLLAYLQQSYYLSLISLDVAETAGELQTMLHQEWQDVPVATPLVDYLLLRGPSSEFRPFKHIIRQQTIIIEDGIYSGTVATFRSWNGSNIRWNCRDELCTHCAKAAFSHATPVHGRITVQWSTRL